MASVALRELVYRSLSNVAALEIAGLVPGAVYPAFSPDSPAERVWLVLRWGTTVPGVGPANSGDLALWAYDREERYDRIEEVLKACRPIMDSLVAAVLAPAGSGAILGVNWQGSGPDGYDDTYPAWTRFESYLVTASGN